MTKLSVNINKLARCATAARKHPNIVQAAIDAQRFGADGITVHQDQTKGIYDTRM